MNRFRSHKSSLFVLTLVTALCGSASAFASQGAWFTQQKAGTACRTMNPNMIPNWSRLLNTDANPQGAWCPLDSDYNGYTPSDVTVDVTPGWATTSSCTLAELTGPNSGYFYFQAYGVSQHGNWDSVVFHVPSQYGLLSSEVECNVPSWQAIYRYSERIYQYFDWTSW